VGADGDGPDGGTRSGRTGLHLRLRGCDRPHRARGRSVLRLPQPG
jgi:hypothetical protein